MKEIKAYIKPHKLSQVSLALHNIEGLTGMSVIDIKGFGRGRGKQQKGEFQKVQDEHLAYEYVPHVKIEIVCNNELVDKIISTIKESAYTGLRGDGIIYVSEVGKALRISSGETGESAV